MYDHISTFRVYFQSVVYQYRELRRTIFLKEAQLVLWKCKQSRATIETDPQFREYQDTGLIKPLQPGKMDVHLGAKLR
jgi:hypothetical protein